MQVSDQALLRASRYIRSLEPMQRLSLCSDRKPGWLCGHAHDLNGECLLEKGNDELRCIEVEGLGCYHFRFYHNSKGLNFAGMVSDLWIPDFLAKNLEAAYGPLEGDSDCDTDEYDPDDFRRSDQDIYWDGEAEEKSWERGSEKESNKKKNHRR